MTITLRNTKGSELSYNELDANFSQLDLKTEDGWRDLVCGLDTRQGPTSPTLSQFREGIYLYAFDPGNMNEAFATAHIGHDFKRGTMLYPHMHWTVNTASTGVVRWGYEYTYARRGDSTGNVAFPATQTLYVDQVADGTNYKHYVAESAEDQGIPHDSIEPDVVVMVRIFRDASHVNDTFPDPVFGFTFDLHYECDRFSTINRTPPFYTL